ncbi:MAG: hypothetical protein Q8933_12010, partial [Bacteroidota bacterium]|nr:hypothetical protein [Bacteroidota bacterium]
MKKSIIYVFVYILALTSWAYAQEKDSLGNYNLKKLSYEDALRIFGPITGKKLNKVTGETREIKDLLIKG